jgi:predicted RNA-binding protein with PIN domain
MPYIIDGNNLINSAPDLSIDDQDAKLKIIDIVQNYQQARKNKVMLVFNELSDNCEYHRFISEKFSITCPECNDSVDAEIKRMLESCNHPQDMIVVTSNHELKKHARKKGIKTVNSIEFYFELKRYCRVSGKKEEQQKRIHNALSDNEVDQWLQIFGE